MKIVWSRAIRKAGAAAVFYGVTFVLLLAATAAPAQDRSLLWKVRSDKSTIYILGSIHFLNKQDVPLKKSIEDVFAAAAKLVLEVDLKAITPEKARQVTAAKGAYRDGATLKQTIGPETYELVAQRAGELGMDVRLLDRVKPWVVAMTLTSLKLQKLGLDPNYGVDRYLAERARVIGKPTGGLETLEFQIGLLDQLPPREQEEMLRQAVKDFDGLERMIESVLQAWKRGDADGLDNLLLAGMREYPELYQKVIVERNRRWLPQIEQLMSAGNDTLLVVGAAHLVGKDGIIAALQARGYGVEQM